MPRSKRNTRRKSAFRKKRSRFSRKKYRNRQQLLSIKTVKNIAKKVVEETPEINYYSHELMTNQAVGNPELFHNAGAYSNDTIPKPRSILLTDYKTCTTLDTNVEPTSATADNGILAYQEKNKLYIKNISVKLQLQSPHGSIGAHKCSQWCDFHWALIRTSNQVYSPAINPAELFKNSWYDQTADFKKENQNVKGYTVVKSGKFSIAPLKTTSDGLNNLSFKIYRKSFNIPIKKVIKIQRKASTNYPLTATDATLAGNINSSNYWMVFYIHQELQGVNSSSYLYNNSTSSPDNAGDQNASPLLNYNITLSGYGFNP